MSCCFSMKTVRFSFQLFCNNTRVLQTTHDRRQTERRHLMRIPVCCRCNGSLKMLQKLSIAPAALQDNRVFKYHMTSWGDRNLEGRAQDLCCLIEWKYLIFYNIIIIVIMIFTGYLRLFHCAYMISSIIQGGPAKVRPTYIFDDNIWMYSWKQVVIHMNIIINSKAKSTSKTISRRFYRRILLTSWKRKIIGLCEYVRVSKMRNVTRAKMPNLSAAIWLTILNIKLLCFLKCVPELLLSH